MAANKSFKKFDIVVSNVRGLGAIQLAQSLLPAFERVAGSLIDNIWLPSTGNLKNYRGILNLDSYKIVKRNLPNSISRTIECFFPNYFYPSENSIIVLGDLPLRHQGKQVVFVHRPHLISSVKSGTLIGDLNAWVSRKIFNINSDFADTIIVQTKSMRTGLLQTYKNITDKIEIIAQPAPEWLISDPIRRTKRISCDNFDIVNLFFPSAEYPHKNHDLLYRYYKEHKNNSALTHITVTLNQPDEFNSKFGIKFVGRLDSVGMRNQYQKTDALLFPSLEESYGLPLVEAICIGLPIICADRPYARALCGDNAIYFDPLSTSSLAVAIDDLRARLLSGWWPNWKNERSQFPKSWDDVAKEMIKLL